MLDAAYTYRNPYHQTNTWTNFLYHNKILAKNRELSRANFEALGVLCYYFMYHCRGTLYVIITQTQTRY